MNQKPEVDHLFRHQYGRMVSILTRIFGLEHLQIVEDAVQDTFYKAILAWRINMPDNPEAWLTAAAKNRVIDIFRKVNSDNKRGAFYASGPMAIAIDDVFLDSEIEDSQLRMIFTACHPLLNPKDQISFALKTVSGFSTAEIGSALLLKDETIKKRLQRARKVISEAKIEFKIPEGKKLSQRLERVHEVLYLIFNEGFHSNKQDILVRSELCYEALRLCKLLLKRKNKDTYALYALMCFHAARLDSKTDENNMIINLEDQDRSEWMGPLVMQGNQCMHAAVEADQFSSYHYEAAIAAEHIKAWNFSDTDWDKILYWYEQLSILAPSPNIQLNQAIVYFQLGNYEKMLELIHSIDPEKLEQRSYLYFAALSDYHKAIKDFDLAKFHLSTAIELVKNDAERNFLENKMKDLQKQG